MATGIIGKKIGMTQVFQEDGSLVGVTAVEAGPCVVTQVKTVDHDGYQAIQLGFGHAKRANKPMTGHFKGAGPFRELREFHVGADTKFEVGQQVKVSDFNAGDLVDVVGTSRGHGFQGGVKRYHFRGGPKTHGQSDRHRAPGSVGANTTPGHVLKGLRMAGHMGVDTVTMQNIRVVQVDADKNLLLLGGPVPGHRNSTIVIKPAKKVRTKKKGPAPKQKAKK